MFGKGFGVQHIWQGSVKTFGRQSGPDVPLSVGGFYPSFHHLVLNGMEANQEDPRSGGMEGIVLGCSEAGKEGIDTAKFQGDFPERVEPDENGQQGMVDQQR